MPNSDYILRSDALKAILGVSIYDTIEELDGARTIAENTWADGLYDAYKIIEEEVDAADVEPKQRWISVTDPEIPLPKPHKRVMVFSKFTGQNTDWIGDNGDWFRTPFVTHWKPLGEPPKEEDDA